MRKNKLLSRIYIGLIMFSGVILAACEAGLTYEEAPESEYSEVGASRFTISARELFENQIYAVNWNQWVENYINTQIVGDTNAKSWTNNTGASFTLPNGTVVADGETVSLTGGITTEDCADAPDGLLYVMNVYVSGSATYSTANKGYLFDGSKFTGEYELVSPTDNRSQQVKLPIRKTELIGAIYLVDYFNCVVEPVGDAPALGTPADFTTPHRYLVKNICYRPAGVEQYQRLFEVRSIFLPE